MFYILYIDELMKRILFYVFTTIIFLLAFADVASAQSKHYYERMREFRQRHDIDGSTIVMFGNSLTEKAGNWTARFKAHGVNATVVNYGITGDNTAGMQQRLYLVTKHHPKAIFIMAGINDVNKSVSASTIFARQKKLIETIRRQSPNTRLFVESLLPFDLSVRTWKPLVGQQKKVRDINRRLEAYCRKQHLTFVNLYPLFTDSDGVTLRRDLTTDGLHLTDEGYDVWIGKIKPLVESVCK